MKKMVLVGLALAACALANSASAIVIGDPSSPDDNCFPFGCAQGNGEYQQAYAFSDFSGPIKISSLTVFGHQENYWTNGTLPSSGTFTLSLSTSEKFGFPQADNLGQDNTVVFRGSLPSLGTHDDLTIQFSQDFLYTPSTTGDLLLDVSWTGANSAARPVYFVASDGFYRSQTGDTSFNDHFGLVTDFGQVPEPASLGLFVLGAVALGASRRKFIGR